MIVFLLYISGVLYFSFLEPGGALRTVLLLPGVDKVAHFLAFFVGLLLWQRSFPRGKTRVVLGFVLLLLPLFIEWVQQALPRRHATLLDGIAGYAGILAGLVVLWLLRKRREKNGKKQTSRE
ncbi:MAG TPA: hypothetical protein P5560_00105 [Thermotogota bacterium]|nr:hypothetical protein [Thermotogota bacterium]HRW91333.1 hypothetical protein [Thermotogota bacterium]